MTHGWLRLYRSAVNNPKVQKYGLEAVGFWTNCLCLSDDDGYIPPVEDLAWALRIEVTLAVTLVTKLVDAALLDVTKDGNTRYRLHDWEEHQFRSNTASYAAEKQRRYRERKRRVTTELPPRYLTRADTDTEKKEDRERAQAREILSDETSSSKPKFGKRDHWPEGMAVPDAWVVVAAGERQRLGLAQTDMGVLATKFVNWHSARQNQPRSKTEWQSCWNNFALNEKGKPNGNGSGQLGKSSIASRVFGDG